MKAKRGEEKKKRKKKKKKKRKGMDSRTFGYGICMDGYDLVWNLYGSVCVDISCSNSRV